MKVLNAFLHYFPKEKLHASACKKHQHFLSIFVYLTLDSVKETLPAVLLELHL